MAFLGFGRCRYCRHTTFKGGTPEAWAKPHRVATRDHVVPKSIGGTKTVLSCKACNNAKGDAPAALFEQYMREHDRVPDAKKFRHWVYSRALEASSRMLEAAE